MLYYFAQSVWYCGGAVELDFVVAYSNMAVLYTGRIPQEFGIWLHKEHDYLTRDCFLQWQRILASHCRWNLLDGGIVMIPS